MRIYEPIAGIEGVASGASATVKVPVNRRLHLIKFFAQATDAVPATVYGSDVMDEILFYVGGKLIRTATAAELLFFAAFRKYSLTVANDGVPVFFSDPRRASVMDEQVTAWDLWGQTDMTIKVKIKAGLTGVTLSAVMAHDDGYTTNDQKQRVLNVLRQTPFYFNAGSTYDITALDVDKPITRIFLFPEAGKSITGVKVVVNDTQTVHELTSAQNVSFLKDYDLVAETGAGKCYPVVFDANQQLFDALPVVRSLRVTVTSSAAGQIKAVLENRANAYV